LSGKELGARRYEQKSAQLKAHARRECGSELDIIVLLPKELVGYSINLSSEAAVFRSYKHGRH